MTLEYGQTPWDEMCREELLLTIWRMYAALNSVYGKLLFDADYGSPIYWGKEGAGGASLERVRQVIEAVAPPGTAESENVYRVFFRYANDLLFERNGYRLLSFGWDVCPECGIMLGETIDGQRKTGQVCKDAYSVSNNACTGVFRPLEWADLHRKDIVDFLAENKENPDALCE